MPSSLPGSGQRCGEVLGKDTWCVSKMHIAGWWRKEGKEGVDAACATPTYCIVYRDVAERCAARVP
jgi:hypothetical protein